MSTTEELETENGSVQQENGTEQQEPQENIAIVEQNHKSKPKSLRDELRDELQKASDPEKQANREKNGRFRPQQNQQQTQQAATQADEIAAPASWKAEAKAQWQNLPPDVRKYINERELEVQRGFTKFDEERNFGKAISQAFSPYSESFKKMNVKPEQAIGTLLQIDNALRNGTSQQKLQLLHTIIRDAGIPLNQLAQYQPQQQRQPDTETLRLAQEVQQLKQAEEQRAIATAQAQIEAFAKDHPHLDAVRADMAVLIEKGIASDMNDAYEKAVWAKPELREKLISEQTDRIRQQNSNQEKVNAARNAGSSINGAPAGNRPTNPTPNRSLRDELAANLRAATSGRI